MRFQSVPKHYLGGPAVIDTDLGALVGICVSELSSDLVAAALHEAMTASPQLYLKNYTNLGMSERELVHRYMMQLVRR